jgi:hypothetical protein
MHDGDLADHKLPAAMRRGKSEVGNPRAKQPLSVKNG